MPIQFIDADDSSVSDDLPWIRDYLKDGGEGDLPLTVMQISVGAKGALILTPYWKGFVFKREKLYGHLVQALGVYVQTTDPLPWLVATATSGGKVRIAIDTDKRIGYWTKEGDSYYQKYSTGGGGDTQSESVNPLLPSPIPPTQTTGSTTSKQNGSRVKS